jgi:hypothetical protein
MIRLLLLTVSFIGGFLLMSIELIYPRISALYFGNTLLVWAADLSLALFFMSIGYLIGSKVVDFKMNNTTIKNCLLVSYLMICVFLIFLPYVYDSILIILLPLNILLGLFLFGGFVMFFTIGLLAFSSPLLVYYYNNLTSSNKNSGMLFSISTIGGVIAIILIGLLSIPFLGIKLTCHMLSVFIFINIILIRLTTYFTK